MTLKTNHRANIGVEFITRWVKLHVPTLMTSHRVWIQNETGSTLEKKWGLFSVHTATTIDDKPACIRWDWHSFPGGSALNQVPESEHELADYEGLKDYRWIFIVSLAIG